MAEKTYYVSIGNSDDKLTQREWARMVEDIDIHLERDRLTLHGRWFSAPDAPFQNACWCFEWNEVAEWFIDGFVTIAKRYGQDSVAFATATTEFLSPPSPQAEEGKD